MDETLLAEYRDKLNVIFNLEDDKTKMAINASMDLNTVEIINEIYPKIEKYLPKKAQAVILSILDESMKSLYDEMRWLNHRHKNRRK